MTCQECELALAGEDRGTEVERHLAGCAMCREFAKELSANADAFRLMAAEPMPPAVIRRPRHWPWVAAVAVAIAAMIVLMFAIPKRDERAPLRSRLTDAPEIIRNSPAPVASVIVHKPRRVPKRNVQPEILQVKMLTADPNVVIYWQIENRKGSE